MQALIVKSGVKETLIYTSRANTTLRKMRDSNITCSVSVVDSFVHYVPKLSRNSFEPYVKQSSLLYSSFANKKHHMVLFILAEDEGFEPSEGLTPRQFSKLLLSATQPIFQYIHCVQIVTLRED